MSEGWCGEEYACINIPCGYKNWENKYMIGRSASNGGGGLEEEAMGGRRREMWTHRSALMPALST